MKASASVDVSKALGRVDVLKMTADLDDVFRDRARLLLLGFALYGYGLVVALEGRRSLEDQYRIYGQGRTVYQLRDVGVPEKWANPHNPVRSWCLPKDSKHLKGTALDVSFSAYDDIPKPVCRHLAGLLGLTWGGDWKVRDYGHFEI